MRTLYRFSHEWHVAATTDAAALARTLVDERLAACVNVLPEMQSFYRWKGFGPMDDFVGWRNYSRVLTDEVFTDAVGHNFIIVGLSIANRRVLASVSGA